VNDEEQLPDVRLSSAVVLLINEPSETDISSILQSGEKIMQIFYDANLGNYSSLYGPILRHQMLNTVV